MRIFVALVAALCAGSALAGQPGAMPLTERPPEDEIIYFVLPDRFENGDERNDRGGIAGTRLDHGFDPAHKGFYQGGDLAGLTARLDYIQRMGATAIWLAPVFKNKPVQGAPGRETSGYHGYWITDFLDVDPHFGTRAEFKALVDAAHARGMKVYMDIITNHTADVIKYEECHGKNAGVSVQADCPYRSIGDYPWSTRGGLDGEPINQGFLGTDPQHLTADNFARLTNPAWAYTPYVPASEKAAKNPAWLNDPIYYTNRGDSVWEGESRTTGDFSGLDDLLTTHPRVVEGFIEIYKQWITDFKVDGFRIDTAKHVNPEFWQAFAPAMLEHARAEGIPNFHIFGEAYEFDPAHLAKFTTEASLPAVLDFAFQGRVRSVVADGKPATTLSYLFETDAVYAKGFATARQLPTFLGNHDMGRFAMFVKQANPGISDAELVRRITLGHALMMFSRGVPTIYYGDEQGFVSDGNDQDARETMFPSVTAVYTDNVLAGTSASVAQSNFDESHPIYRAIAAMAAIRKAEPALRQGLQITRHADHEPRDGSNALVFSRLDPDGQGEVVVAFNAGNAPRDVAFPVDARARRWISLSGACPANSPAPGTYRLTIPATGHVVCKAEY
ncbi:alpha-amylase [Porphyrobacter sp. HT-58-2]|uniref:alpha-amylase family glycosyl hydrolase n=1 Tax=Porphyrobacter sp. HT-58-2 TaxID=2023229 RepID=UPI000CDC6C53|nr:alpha-amylase family glycosyl hydrolase [Porphyrobacter sp. HT-58-2]AUX70575.1 alpha-amylase [Porphyrobacter sp. HT-58-2]